MKNLVAIFSAIVLALCFTACGDKEEDTAEVQDSGVEEVQDSGAEEAQDAGGDAGDADAGDQ